MHRPAGFTLVELCLLLVLFALLSALAVPSFSGVLARERARGTMNRLAAEIHLARALAARAGEPVRLRFEPEEGCARRYLIEADDGAVLRSVEVGRDGVCLSSNVARPMHVNGRGMLSGSPRRLYAASGAAVDSAVVSIVGRVLRPP